MNLQTFVLMLLLAILGEFTEPRDAFKLIRPYKCYNPRLRSHKPRWQSLRGPSPHGTLKKNRSKHPNYYYRRPPSAAWQEQRYLGRKHAGKEPYTIKIELPRRHESSPWINDPHSRNYALGKVEDHYGDENDYRVEPEEFEDRVIQTVMNGVRIKLAKDAKPELTIKLSRDGSVENIVNSQNSINAGTNERHDSSSEYFMGLGRFGATKNRIYMYSGHG